MGKGTMRVKKAARMVAATVIAYTTGVVSAKLLRKWAFMLAEWATKETDDASE